MPTEDHTAQDNAPQDSSRRRLLRLAPLLPLAPFLWWAVSRRPDPDAGKLRITAIDVGMTPVRVGPVTERRT